MISPHDSVFDRIFIEWYVLNREAEDDLLTGQLGGNSTVWFSGVISGEAIDLHRQRVAHQGHASGTPDLEGQFNGGNPFECLVKISICSLGFPQTKIHQVEDCVRLGTSSGHCRAHPT